HSLITDQDILKRIVQNMSHVQLSCDIRRRHHRRKRLSAPVYFCVKILVLTPFFIKLRFNLLRIVRFVQLSAHHYLLISSVPVNNKTPFTYVKGVKTRYHLFYTPVLSDRCISLRSITGTTPGSPTVLSLNRTHSDIRLQRYLPQLLLVITFQPAGNSLCQGQVCTPLYQHL